MNKRKKYIIIGASAAGISALKAIYKHDLRGDIVCITTEKESPYNKCFLAPSLADSTIPSQLSLAIPESSRITLMHNTHVIHSDPAAHTITCSTGEIVSYDKLLLATGSSPRLITFPGYDNAPVIPFHTHASLKAIINHIEYSNNRSYPVTIIGAGINGLECADALVQRGFSVVLIEKTDQCAAGVSDKNGADLIIYSSRSYPITYYSETTIKNLLPARHANNRAIVELSNGQSYETTLIIPTIGVVPNSILAQTSNLALLPSDHIRVNDLLQTSHPDIYAAGDLIAFPHTKTGVIIPSTTWPDAMYQGLLCGNNMAGNMQFYRTFIPFINSSFFGISCFATGTHHIISAKTTKKIIEQTDTSYEVHWYDDHATMVAFIVLGKSASYHAQLRRSFL